MSVESSGKAKEIFLAAIEIPIEEGREQFLKNACQSNHELRRRVDALISAHESPESLLDGNAPNLDAGEDIESTIGLSEMEKPGTHIGPYKLRERLGVGGMGVVWAAEQKQPISRKVAIKIVKPGMDTEQVLARFDVEREALSLMDHPNIARVLDAGTTERGRPYFVMELIRGIPITDYCDAKKLTISDRLKLFTQVCKAVQHAHQKGIIHRDIKPSNVLVSEQDGEPIVKVIDFGVAKALFHSGDESSVYSGIFQAIGTLAYMSPEQAGLSISDVDTRSDVYSLGVLLYELATGFTPFNKNQLKTAALDEAFRIIRENDPPKPSTRASSLGEAGRSVAQCRQTDLKGLFKAISGDLDWITMKCLDKDRKRRYDTPSALADDVTRLLNDEEIIARAPTVIHRLRRTLRRNRAAIVVLIVLFLVLTIIAGFGWSNYLSLAALHKAERVANIPILLDSVRQSEKVGDFAEAAAKYRTLIDIGVISEKSPAVARYMAGHARAMVMLDRLDEAEDAFDNALSEITRIADDHEQNVSVLVIRDYLAECSTKILDHTVSDAGRKATALRLANLAYDTSVTYGLETSQELYAALALSQFENSKYRPGIATCLQWLSDKNFAESYLAYLILSAACSEVGDIGLARDWWLVCNNGWISPRMLSGIRYQELRRRAQNFLSSSSHEDSWELSTEEEERVYSRLLDRYPDSLELRKMRGYCLFQLGRWDEARDEFDILVRRGWLNPYLIATTALIQLFYEGDSHSGELAEDLKRLAEGHFWHHDMSGLAIAAMIADRDGQLADEKFLVHVYSDLVASGLVLFRANQPDEAYSVLSTYGGTFPARDAVADIVRALIEWERGENVMARKSLSRAEALIEQIAPREGIPRTHNEVGYASSIIWLEPLLLLREARETIPRDPNDKPHPIDASLYPRDSR
jgi:serine/threonine protein kinase